MIVFSRSPEGEAVLPGRQTPETPETPVPWKYSQALASGPCAQPEPWPAVRGEPETTEETVTK